MSGSMPYNWSMAAIVARRMYDIRTRPQAMITMKNQMHGFSISMHV